MNTKTKMLATSRSKTNQLLADQIQAALARLLEMQSQSPSSRLRITPASLAREAGIDRSTLYRSYPEYIAKVRDLSSGQPVKKPPSREAEYRALLEDAQRQVGQLANITYRQKIEIESLMKRCEEQERSIAELRKSLASAGPAGKNPLQVVR